ILQSSKVVDGIRAGSVKKVLGLLEDLAQNDKDKYAKFWKEFGRALKEGPAEDYGNREQIAKLFRFASTHADSAEQTVSLSDYLGRMKEGQDKIYYISAESFAAAKNSPHLEIFRKKGLEVLLMTDRVDEWLMSHLNEFEGKRFQSVAKGALDLDKIASEEEKQEQKQAEDQYKDLLAKVKEVLGDQVKEVRVSTRLTDSPACLVVDEYALSAHLERMLRDAGQNVPTSKPYLELNPQHPLVGRLQGEADAGRFDDLTHLLFEQALLAEGGQLEDPASFVKRLNALLLAAG
ncbi:MAG TPA: molecular chaperone HtpG, partial [Candidatus Competibacteraceae bacterium]|nr:molecular chaperone HtpG [Candidatus Competibacteraceae bacterium]